MLRLIQFEREHTMSSDDKEKAADGAEGNAQVGRPSRRLDKSVQTAIGARLRSYYDGVEREAIPDRFVELLKQLEKKDPGGDKGP